MKQSIRNGIFFIVAGVFCLLLGMSLNESTGKDETVKYLFMVTGISILNLYIGLSWKKPSYGGGLVHKYAAISTGAICGIYSFYLLIKLFN